MAQRRQADAGLNHGRRVVLTRLGPAAAALPAASIIPGAGGIGALRGLAALAGVGGLAGLGGLAGCAGARRPAVPAQSVDGGPFVLPMAAPAPRLGERWLYGETNDYNGVALGRLELRVSSLMPLVLVQRRLEPTPAATMARSPRGENEIRFDAPWSAQVDADFDDVYQLSPAVPLLPPRLEPGSSIRTRHRFTVRGNSGRYGWQQRVAATAAEIIQTPAGRFDTLVIDREIWFDSPEPFRYDRYRRETRWYAPAVNGFVRRTWTGSYLEEGSIDQRDRRREDWITQDLIEHHPGRG